jgi:hypothetical protein
MLSQIPALGKKPLAAGGGSERIIALGVDAGQRSMGILARGDECGSEINNRMSVPLFWCSSRCVIPARKPGT